MLQEKKGLESTLIDLVKIAEALNRHPNSIRYAIVKKYICKPKKVFIGGRFKLMFSFGDYCQLKEYFYREKEGYYGKKFK